MFDAIADGTIKAVWIACTNPAQSLPQQKRVHEALAARGAGRRPGRVQDHRDDATLPT
jgi:hypothetical protein